MALRTKVKYGLSAAMLALIAAGASAPQLLDQFLQEREGNTLVAVRDNGGVWSVCRGVTRIDGKLVVKGQRLTQSQCDHYNAIERDKGKRAARTVLTGMCYSVGSATRQGSSSPTRFIGQSAMTSRT